MPITVLALDLEGTLLSNAFSRIPRPGVHRFLEFCRAVFPRLVLFTAVASERARIVLEEAAAAGDFPEWVPDVIEIVEWSGPYKDLSLIPGAAPATALLVDDQESYVHPEQVDRWVRVEEFAAPYPDDDTGLAEAEAALRTRLGLPASRL